MISRTNVNLFLASVSNKYMKMKQIWPKTKYAYDLYIHIGYLKASLMSVVDP